MIELLKDYIEDSIPENEKFVTNLKLTEKVDVKRNFLPYYGNTVVFKLDEDTQEELKKLQEQLYTAAGWMLSKRLKQDTFHMTLHDLVSGPQLDDDLQRRMAEAEQGTVALLKQWKGRKNIRMKATWLFNMVNTSIVLGLEPVDGENRKALSELYTALEDIVFLDRRLTPHITMAYFCPGTYFPYEVKRLKAALKPVELEVELRMKELAYQSFKDMNHYVDEALCGD